MKPSLLPILATLALVSCKQRPSETGSVPYPDTVGAIGVVAEAVPPARVDTVDTARIRDSVADPKAWGKCLTIPTCDTIPGSVFRYQRTLSAWRAQGARHGMEELWRVADTAADRLESALQGLTGRDFFLASRAMELHVVANDEQIMAHPDLDSFLAMARRSGLPQDVRFFEFVQTHLGQFRLLWNWDEPYCDGCFCTRLESPEVVDGYFAAETLLAKNGSAYAWWVRPRLESALAQIPGFSETCADKATTIAGLEASLRRVQAKHPLRAALDSALRRVRNLHGDDSVRTFKVSSSME